jgi:hypothetical protein
MKVLSIVLAALTCLPILALAVPDSMITGPYNVSFDLGLPKSAYDIEIAPPDQQESLNGDISTVYLMTIDNSNKSDISTCMIVLSASNSQLPTASPQTLERTARNELGKMDFISNIESSIRIIDGSNGAIASGDSSILGKGNEFKEYNAMYNVKTGPNPRHLVCSIFSSYPWEEGTLSLLKTIHIEMVNATT